MVYNESPVRKLLRGATRAALEPHVRRLGVEERRSLAEDWFSQSITDFQEAPIETFPKRIGRKMRSSILELASDAIDPDYDN